jgi:hypothetical protein
MLEVRRTTGVRASKLSADVLNIDQQARGRNISSGSGRRQLHPGYRTTRHDPCGYPNIVTLKAAAM